MPATRSPHSSNSSHSHYSPLSRNHNIPRRNDSFPIYEYARLTENFNNLQEFADAVVDEPELNCDVHFLDHVNRTIRQMEESLSNQRQIADHIFERLLERDFEQKVIHIVRKLRPQPLPRRNPHSLIPEVIRIQSTPILSRSPSLESFETNSSSPVPAPLGSIHNPIVVDDDDQSYQETFTQFKNVRDRTPTPGLRRSSRARQFALRVVQNLKRG